MNLFMVGLRFVSISIQKRNGDFFMYGAVLTFSTKN